MTISVSLLLESSDQSRSIYQIRGSLCGQEERHPPPVGGEEWRRSSFGARQFDGVGLVQPAGEELSLRNVHEARTVG